MVSNLGRGVFPKCPPFGAHPRVQQVEGEAQKLAFCPVVSGDGGEQVVGGPPVEKLLQEVGVQAGEGPGDACG